MSLIEKAMLIDLQDENPERIFFVSDPHFDHANIIDYCKRPFSDVNEMNHVIEENWRTMIPSDGRVIFLGDMSFGRGSRSPRWWAERLNGRKIYIKGNHDRGVGEHSNIKTVDRIAKSGLLILSGCRIYLNHFPDNIPNDWKGWSVHGHIHNNGPFLNVGRKRINVSLDVTKFKPVPLTRILEIIEGKGN